MVKMAVAEEEAEGKDQTVETVEEVVVLVVLVVAMGTFISIDTEMTWATMMLTIRTGEWLAGQHV